MNLNKYTEKAQEAILAAQQLAERASHAQIEPEHLLVALVEQRDGIVPEVLRKMQRRPGADRARRAGAARARCRRRTAARSRACRRACERSPTSREAEAERLKDEFVSTEHLLLAIASETGRSPAARAAHRARADARQDLRRR